MWNSAATLGVIGTWGVWLAATFAVLAAISGLIGGVAANRSADIINREANKKIAEANERAEAARLETARIWEQVAWRRVSNQQRAILRELLKGETFEVWTSFVGHDPESAIFRNELDAALREAGLKTKFFSGWEVAYGLKISGAPSSERDKLAQAFHAAGLQFTVEPPGSFAKNDLVVVVGTKPEPVRK